MSILPRCGRSNGRWVTWGPTCRGSTRRYRCGGCTPEDAWAVRGPWSMAGDNHLTACNRTSHLQQEEIRRSTPHFTPNFTPHSTPATGGDPTLHTPASPKGGALFYHLGRPRPASRSRRPRPQVPHLPWGHQPLPCHRESGRVTISRRCTEGDRVPLIDSG